jgi:hypothetical protein
VQFVAMCHVQHDEISAGNEYILNRHCLKRRHT